jgi:hypothetical protein
MRALALSVGFISPRCSLNPGFVIGVLQKYVSWRGLNSKLTPRNRFFVRSNSIRITQQSSILSSQTYYFPT